MTVIDANETTVITETTLQTLETEPGACTLVGRAREGSYYRSRLFTAQCGDNALLLAARPLLLLIQRLGDETPGVDLKKLNDLLDHELIAFTNRSQQSGYSHEWVSFAHYLLCSTLDDNLLDKNITEFSAVKHYTKYQDKLTGDLALFKLIDELLQMPDPPKDVLTLIYYCLMFGLQGKSRFEYHGTKHIHALAQQLFQRLQAEDNDDASELFLKAQATTSINKTSTVLSVLAMVLIIALMILSINLVFTFMLNSAMKPLLTQITGLLGTITH